MTDYEIELEIKKALKEHEGEGKNTPVNLSYWNSGSDYKRLLTETLKLDGQADLFDYQYYFPEDVEAVIACKLGFSAQDCKKLYFHPLTQSTLSIAILSVLLLKMGVKLGIIAPAYFSVQSCFDDLKLPYARFDGFMENINAAFDADLLLQSDCDAFFFTSPVNSCGIYFNAGVRAGIQKLLDAGKLVILDESLCINGRELCRAFGAQENLIYIYSPHKTLGIQGIKFSTLVVHRKFYEEIDSLNDGYGGSLNYSCQQGYLHFASPNFDDCLAVYNSFWQENLAAVRRVLASYAFARLSPQVAGHYVMVFIDRPLSDRSVVDGMKVLMKEQGYFVYPGSMQGFDASRRFCFRLNLLLDRADLEQGLKVVLDYLQNNTGAEK